MNIRCPACKTLFRLADEKVGPGGVKLRCGRCKHVFSATRADAVEPGLRTVPEAERSTPSPPDPPAASSRRSPWEPPREWVDQGGLVGKSPLAPSPAVHPAPAPRIDPDESRLGRPGPGRREEPEHFEPPPRVVQPPPGAPVRAERPPQAARPAFDDETVVQTHPSWLGGFAETLDSARGAASAGVGGFSPAVEPIDPFAREVKPRTPTPPPVDTRSAGALRAEELFGRAEPTPPPAPRAPVTPRPAAPPPREALEARRQVAWEIPAPRRGARGGNVVVRASLALVVLGLVFCIFVMWRNEWRFSSFGAMMARAFAPQSAGIRSLVAGLEVHNVRRVFGESALGQRMLTISGELRNTTPSPIQGTSVLVRFVDRGGTVVAEREQWAVGLFEPPVLAGFRDAADVDDEYRKRQARSIVPPDGKLEFMIVFFPIPQELIGKRLRMLIEVTSGASNRG